MKGKGDIHEHKDKKDMDFDTLDIFGSRYHRFGVLYRKIFDE
jgi:hypothetical protein